MFARSPQSPQQDASAQPQLPTGQCRFILLNPEVRGHRCACVGFTLNRSLPGVTCECGHLSCYHIKVAEPSLDKSQVERRLQLLEDALDRGRQGSLGSSLGNTLSRLGNLEDQVEKSKGDIQQEIRAIYRQISRTWELLEGMEKGHANLGHQVLQYREQVNAYEKRVRSLDNRMMEDDDAAMDLEERVERLERLKASTNVRNYVSSSDPQLLNGSNRLMAKLDDEGIYGTGIVASSVVRRVGPGLSSTLTHNSMNQRTAPWTVHVSLLPTKDQPFPFEKDTTAYKRCLSRGLHRMVAIPGTDSESFVRAVSNAFKDLLKGRPWVPIQARLCDAEKLQGLPMLRSLAAALIGNHYDLDFLHQHCAVCGPDGKLDSLYIAMESEKLSWHFLRNAPCYLEGLEDSWRFDALLDPSSPFEDNDIDEGDRPSAGDILKPLPTLKRSASEISRTSSFSSGSAGDAEGSRTKMARTSCVPVPMELRRRVGTV